MRTRSGATSRRLLGLLIERGPAHRADLSRALGVSRTTVTNLATTLTDSSVLIELERDVPGAPADGTDRRLLKQRLAISARCGVLASVVFRMTSIAVTVGTLDGRILATDTAELLRDAAGPERMDRARELFEQVLEGLELEATDVLRLHLAVNAQCDRESGEVIAEQAAGPWRGMNPKQVAQQWTPAEVAIENTARLTGLAEYRALGDPRPRSLVYVHLSWGVTMGQVVDGEIISGSHGGAGELGHVSIDPMGPPCACANRGCLMLYAGLDTVTERLRAVLGPEAGIADAVAAITEGSQSCATIIEDVGESVGRALAMVCNVVDPDVIVLGGELATAGDLLSDAVRASVRRRALSLVTRRLDVTSATTAGDLHATGEAALSAMRADLPLVDDLLTTVLEG